MPWDAEDAPLLVVSGIRGRGKTTWIREHPFGQRTVTLDTMGEYEDGAVLWTAEDFFDWIERGGPRAPSYSVILRTPREDADMILRAVWDCGPCMLRLEEADRYVGPDKQPIPGWSYLIEYGRHAGVGMTAATRRPFRIPRDFTANAQRGIIFATQEPRDVAYWREFLPEGAAEAMESLTGHDYLDADLDARTFAVVRERGAA